MKNLIRLSMVLLVLIFGHSLKAQQKYQLDPGHTFIMFSTERFMVGEVTGKFKDFEGTVSLNANNEVSGVEVLIQTASLDSDHEIRDGHLKGTIWLDVANYPAIKFVSKKIWKEGSDRMISGDLTIKGVTNEVQFPFTMQGPFKDPTGVTAIGIKGDLMINRQDYNINFSRLMDNGELFIGNEVKITIRALAGLM